MITDDGRADIDNGGVDINGDSGGGNGRDDYGILGLVVAV